MLFIHSQRYQWHNDDPYYDGVPMINRVQIPYLQQHGYANLRCPWILGCPVEIRPHTARHREDVHAGEYFKTGFMELFPDEDVPEEVGVSCCAQFGVTRWKILERPRSEYIRFRNWLAETELTDELSGRIMEYSWHSMLRQVIYVEFADLSSGLWPKFRLLPNGRGVLLQRLRTVQSVLS